MSLKNFATLIIFAMVSMGALAGNATSFINVDITVNEVDQEAPTSVKLRIPMGMIRAMAPQIDEVLTQVNLEQAEVENNQIDLRAIWNEMRNAGPNEYADIQTDDAQIQVNTTDTHMNIVVKGRETGDLKIQLPLALGDALLSLDNPTADDLIVALQGLEGDLLTINGEQINGRVWVD